MAIIPEKHIESITPIGIYSDDEHTNIAWLASGFFVGRFEGIDSNNQERYTVYLVTNKHVISDLKEIVVQFNTKSGTTTHLFSLYDKLGNPLYSGHPDNDVDIVALNVVIEPEIDDCSILCFFALNNESLDTSSMRIYGVAEGSFIYTIGYPVGIDHKLVTDIHKCPTCRFGCISRIEHLYHSPKQFKFYLIDSQVYPGNSGSPVISRPEFISIQGTPSYSNSALLGIIKGHLDYQDVLVSRQTKQNRMITTENSGLAIVFPVEDIIDTVEIERTRALGIPPTGTIKLP